MILRNLYFSLPDVRSVPPKSCPFFTSTGHEPLSRDTYFLPAELGIQSALPGRLRAAIGWPVDINGPGSE